MPLGMEVGLGPGNFVFDEDPGTPRKRAHDTHPIFSTCLLWPNGWMDEDATWYGSRPRTRPHCIGQGPSSPRKGHSSPSPAVFLAHVYCGMLPMSIAWFSSGMLTIGRIAYRREGVMRSSVIYDCLLPLPVQLIAWSKTLSLE